MVWHVLSRLLIRTCLARNYFLVASECALTCLFGDRVYLYILVLEFFYEYH